MGIISLVNNSPIEAYGIAKNTPVHYKATSLYVMSAYGVAYMNLFVFG